METNPLDPRFTTTQAFLSFIARWSRDATENELHQLWVTVNGEVERRLEREFET